MISKIIFILALFVSSALFAQPEQEKIGQTEIKRWQYGKKTAISITYDGGTINQFKVAVPIMDKLSFPATFFIVTGDITGSQYQGKFIGRPVDEILRETEKIQLNKDNFFERATALRFLDYEGAREYHTRAGDLFELGKFEEAYKQIDEAYRKICQGELKHLDPKVAYDNPTVDISWNELKEIARRGYEFGSHSITHPQPAICDDVNLKYELEKSKEEILNHLGPKHIFSAECPHGSENNRVMGYALAIYSATRNRMPENFLEEINRWSKKDPTISTKEYVQWQRGPKTSTSAEEMKKWVDTSLTHNNIWLVLTIHGIDGIGYEPKTGEEIKNFFNYIKSNEDKIWVATFQDATKYMRERMNGKVNSSKEDNSIKVTLTHTLDSKLYDLSLTLKTYIPTDWKSVIAKQGDKIQHIQINKDEQGSFVLYQATPNFAPIELLKEGVKEQNKDTN